MRKIPHNLQHLIELPDYAQTCDILRVHRIRREAVGHAGKTYLVTALLQEVWQRKQRGTFQECGEAITLLRERSPGTKPFILFKVSSTGRGETARFSEEADALDAQQEDLRIMRHAFFDLFSAMPEKEPA